MLMQRRSFIKQAGLGSGALFVPGLLQFACNPPAAAAAAERNIVMIHLRGGNDWLNTVIPYANPAYYKQRPGLAIHPDEVLPLDHQYGLHPCMGTLLPLYKNGQMLILNGVGIPQQELSHYHAAAIWQTGLEKPDGQKCWLQRAEDLRRKDCKPAADRLANEITMTPALPAIPEDADNSCCVDDFGEELRRVADILNAASGQPMHHIALDGFDTHQMQQQRHAMLLRALSDGLSSFFNRLEETSNGRSTLVVVYSEFGRTARENNKRGTEHGNGGNLIVLGRSLRSQGIYNPLPDLEKNSLPAVIDFREVYATLLSNWLDSDAEAVLGKKYPLMSWV